MREMRRETAKVLVVLGGVAVGVVGFIGLLAFFVSDSCLDLGGAVGSSPFVCVVDVGKVIPWVVLVRPVVVILSAGFVAVPVIFVVRWLLRRVERKHGSSIHA
jgi:O-antigen/teichoic acid export membrane protein